MSRVQAVADKSALVGYFLHYVSVDNVELAHLGTLFETLLRAGSAASRPRQDPRRLKIEGVHSVMGCDPRVSL